MTDCCTGGSAYLTDNIDSRLQKIVNVVFYHTWYGQLFRCCSQGFKLSSTDQLPACHTWATPRNPSLLLLLSQISRCCCCCCSGNESTIVNCWSQEPQIQRKLQTHVRKQWTWGRSLGYHTYHLSELNAALSQVRALSLSLSLFTQTQTLPAWTFVTARMLIWTTLGLNTEDKS